MKLIECSQTRALYFQYLARQTEANIRRISNIFRTPARLVMEKWVPSWYWIYTTIVRLVCRYFITESFMESNKFAIQYSHVQTGFIKVIFIQIFNFPVLILFIPFCITFILKNLCCFFAFIYFNKLMYIDWNYLLSRVPSIMSSLITEPWKLLHQS